MKSGESLNGKTMDRITVLLASYQGEAYIGEQLDSILEQTVSGIRIVVSDDGSADRTGEILEEYRERFPQQIVLRHHVKEGLFDARRADVPPAAMNFFWLLAQGEGDYILLSDQDDVWKRNKVEVLLERMKELESRLGCSHPILVHSDMEVVDQKLNRISPSLFAYQHGKPERASLAQVLVENPVTGGAVMMNRALAEKLQKVPQSCFMHDWWIALAAACFGTISFVPEALYLYRQHGQNTLGAKKIGSAEELKERLGRQQQVEEAYRKMFAQAAAFEAQYREQLTPEQSALLQAYLALPQQSPAGRLCSIVRNRFFKSSGIHTLAQCITIPGSGWNDKCKNKKGEL